MHLTTFDTVLILPVGLNIRVAASKLPLHAAADAQVPKLEVLVRYAFAVGRKALPDADAAIKATEKALKALLPAALEKLVAAGIKATPEIRAAGGPGSGNFGHAGRPGEIGGSSNDGGNPNAKPGDYGKDGDDQNTIGLPKGAETEDGAQEVFYQRLEQLHRSPEGLHFYHETAGDQKAAIQKNGIRAGDYGIYASINTPSGYIEGAKTVVKFSLPSSYLRDQSITPDHRYQWSEKLGAHQMLLKSSRPDLKGAWVGMDIEGIPPKYISEITVTKGSPRTLRTAGLPTRKQAASDWAEEHAADLIKGISKTTRERVNAAVAANTDRPLEMLGALKRALGDEDRARTIARTESMRAVHKGQQIVWQEAQDEGLLAENAKRTWIVTDDDKLCPICEPLDGKTAALDDAYDAGSEYLDGPPAHPNCRCTEGLA